MRRCCRGAPRHWYFSHHSISLSLSHFPFSSSLPSLLPSLFSPYCHESTKLRKTNDLFAVLNLISNPEKMFLCEQIKPNAPPITCVCDNTCRYTQFSSFPRWQKHWASTAEPTKNRVAFSLPRLWLYASHSHSDVLG